jgi:hypothetical protein
MFSASRVAPNSEPSAFRSDTPCADSTPVPVSAPPVSAPTGLILGATVNKRWLWLSAIVQGFFMQHAIQGWCPPLPIFRVLGVRTQREIEAERHALQALLGEYDRSADGESSSDGNATRIFERWHEPIRAPPDHRYRDRNSVARAPCPLCDSETAEETRAGIFNDEFLPALFAGILPFAILAGIALAVHIDCSRIRAGKRSTFQG